MKEIKTRDEFFSFISSKELTMVVFSTHDCSTCKIVKEKIDVNFEDIKTANVYIDEIKELSGELSIFNVPVVCLFFDGKELHRFVRIFSISGIREKLNRIQEFI